MFCFQKHKKGPDMVNMLYLLSNIRHYVNIKLVSSGNSLVAFTQQTMKRISA